MRVHRSEANTLDGEDERVSWLARERGSVGCQFFHKRLRSILESHESMDERHHLEEIKRTPRENGDRPLSACRRSVGRQAADGL